ncbi:AAA family ATPase [candidate division GN15 bacterium]|nr:AAA family ATPase [candidate division GN15 bacterium]
MNRLTLTRNARPSGETSVVSVLSGKGGVGKSLIAFNLAERLAVHGNRVLLIDADFSSGNQHILANVRCEVGVRQFAAGELSLAEAVTKVSDFVDLLGASWSGSVIDDFDVMGTAHLVRMIREQSGGYDLVIIDHGSGISKPATVMAHASDVSLLVVLPELTSIADAYGLFKFLVQTNKSIDCRLLLNRCQSDDEADYIQRKFAALAERFLGQAPAVIGSLPETEQMRTALARQLPLAAVDEQSLVCQTLTRIARQLAGAEPVRSIAQFFPAEIDGNENPATADIKG